MSYEQIFQLQQEFFNSQQTKEVDFRKENLSKLKGIFLLPGKVITYFILEPHKVVY